MASGLTVGSWVKVSGGKLASVRAAMWLFSMRALTAVVPS